MTTRSQTHPGDVCFLRAILALAYKTVNLTTGWLNFHVLFLFSFFSLVFVRFSEFVRSFVCSFLFLCCHPPPLAPIFVFAVTAQPAPTPPAPRVHDLG